jgi:MtN3 and saliva related transmembrane protein
MIGPAAAVPQVYDVFARQSAEGLSLTTWTLWTILSCFWVYYGYVHKEAPILWANLIYIVLQGLVVYGILIYS